MAITRLWFFTPKPPVSPTDPAFTSLWTEVLELYATYTPTPGPTTAHGHIAALSKSCPHRPHHFLFQSISSSASSTTSPSPSPQPYPSSPSSSSSSTTTSNTSSAAPTPSQNGTTHNEPATSDAEPPLLVLISTYPSLALYAQAEAAYARSPLRARLRKTTRHRALRQLDTEDAEAIPALLSPRGPGARSLSDEGARGAPHDGGDGKPAVTVMVSRHDPLRYEVAESLSRGLAGGARGRVPPPDEEISGADVFVPPLLGLGLRGRAGRVFGGREEEEVEEEEEDVYAGQRGEERRWVRISRRPDVDGGGGDVEVFRLRELLSR